MIKKNIRTKIWAKFDYKCAYCGCDLKYHEMQIDHVKSLRRYDSDLTLEAQGVERGKDEESNYFPSCARCNRWKKTFSVEMFRKEIQKQPQRLFKYSNQYRMALDYNLIKVTGQSVKFWFEHW